MRRCVLLLVIGSALASSGCWRTTLRSGLPPAEEAQGYDERVHDAYVLGAIETGDPHPLDALCPHGWAEIHVRKGFINGFLTLITLGIYSPQTITVVCALDETYPAAPPQVSLPRE